jgi:hypothetical protein
MTRKRGSLAEKIGRGSWTEREWIDAAVADLEAGEGGCLLDAVERSPGEGGGRGYTLEQTGDHFGVTRERVRQIEIKALAELAPITEELK